MIEEKGNSPQDLHYEEYAVNIAVGSVKMLSAFWLCIKLNNFDLGLRKFPRSACFGCDLDTPCWAINSFPIYLCWSTFKGIHASFQAENFGDLCLSALIVYVVTIYHVKSFPIKISSFHKNCYNLPILPNSSVIQNIMTFTIQIF